MTDINAWNSCAWHVLKDVKPAVEFMCHSEEEYEQVVGGLECHAYGLKLHRKDWSDHDIMVHIYKYDHVREIIDQIYNSPLYHDIDNPVRHVLSAYIYGIPAHMVEEFCTPIKGV
jgi:hypothetical protein